MLIIVTTQQGKEVAIISQTDLRDPAAMGERVRAYCHIHGSDHQRSLSINRQSGWGRCFNASCQTTVLVAEWNQETAQQLLYRRDHPALPEVSTASRAIQPPLPFRVVGSEPSSISEYLPPVWQQDEQLSLMALEELAQAALLHSPQARAYLEGRAIPLEVAQQTGVGYLPSGLLTALRSPRQRRNLRRWCPRLLFPLVAPGERGYIGRALARWRPGMDENRHKVLLEQSERQRRWIKTNPAGWFCSELKQLPRQIIIVEGAFDRLTLLAAGFQAADVVALVGTSAPIEWLPAQVEAVVLALDGDQGGHDASNRLSEHFEQAGIAVTRCLPPTDRWGKDWNERWRRIGPQSVWPLFEAFTASRPT